MKYCKALAVVCLAAAFSTAYAAPSVGYVFESKGASGQSDFVLTGDVISKAVYQGVRDGGIAAATNPSTVDALVHIELNTTLASDFQSLRIVSGTFSLKAPRAGAGNFSRPVLLCQYGLQLWKTSENSTDAAMKLRDAIYQQAVQFARQCGRELSNF
jgi:hypothetical protein